MLLGLEYCGLVKADCGSVDVGVQEDHVRILATSRHSKMVGEEHECVCEDGVEFVVPFPEFTVDGVFWSVVVARSMKVRQAPSEERCYYHYAGKG